MEFKISGKLKLLFEAQSWDSGFSKREFVITTQEQYPQDVKFECIKDKISMLDGLNPGDELTVSFNVRGNEYNDRYFVNLQAWKIESNVSAENTPPSPAPPDNELEPLGEDESDDLPF